MTRNKYLTFFNFLFSPFLHLPLLQSWISNGSEYLQYWINTTGCTFKIATSTGILGKYYYFFQKDKHGSKFLKLPESRRNHIVDIQAL